MGRTAGIPLVDLFELTDQSNAVLPPVFQNFTDRFVVTQHHLLRDPGCDRVKIIGLATVRFSQVGNADMVIRCIDESDPLDPTAASGGVFSLNCSPPSRQVPRRSVG